ncbi:UPF0575 protein C19orf67 homolog isoform X2 [Narcine bancroftii]|uniref:UPF0575 protein C19orf67 homolog isoform X2 n=1 Tax=Narcine bancroftii TaxID=1343680 RepID=UPI003831DB18
MDKSGSSELSCKKKDQSKYSSLAEVTNRDAKETPWTDSDPPQLVAKGKQSKETEEFLPFSSYPSISSMEALQDFSTSAQDAKIFQPLHQDDQPREADEEKPQYDVTLMEGKLQPIEQQLQYLLKKAEEFQTHLVYRDRIHNEEFARAVPIFVKTCQPYFAYLECTARSTHPDRKPLPRYIRKRLLQFSQHLASSLEQLVLMYASFGFISLEETDPCSISYFYRGEFRLGQCFRVSIYRYCMAVPYTVTREPKNLFKKVRWNVDTIEGTAFGNGTELCTEYYFLCYKETNEVMDSNPEVFKSTSALSKSKKLWSIGRWVQVEPAPGDLDLLCWVLYKQPRGDYELLVNIGFDEPTQIAATDLFVDILMHQRAANISRSCLPKPQPPPYLQVQSQQESSATCQAISGGPDVEAFTD